MTLEDWGANYLLGLIWLFVLLGAGRALGWWEERRLAKGANENWFFVRTSSQRDDEPDA